MEDEPHAYCGHCHEYKAESEYYPSYWIRRAYQCIDCCRVLGRKQRAKRMAENAEEALKKSRAASHKSWRNMSSEAHEHRKNKKVEYYHQKHGYTYRLRQHLNMPAAFNTVGKIHLLPGEKVEIVNEPQPSDL